MWLYMLAYECWWWKVLPYHTFLWSKTLGYLYLINRMSQSPLKTLRLGLWNLKLNMIVVVESFVRRQGRTTVYRFCLLQSIPISFRRSIRYSVSFVLLLLLLCCFNRRYNFVSIFLVILKICTRVDFPVELKNPKLLLTNTIILGECHFFYFVDIDID